ncbi:MAG: hypothetical protein WC504_05435 [Methylobacter sp.]
MSRIVSTFIASPAQEKAGETTARADICSCNYIHVDYAGAA